MLASPSLDTRTFGLIGDPISEAFGDPLFRTSSQHFGKVCDCRHTALLEFAMGHHSKAKACELGLEGIVSKRAGSFYLSGRSRNWLKTKNPAFVRT
jgi:hypothetical protein